MPACRWIALNVVVALHLLQEQKVADSIFGSALGRQAFLEVIKPGSALAVQFATSLIGFRRIPEKARPHSFCFPKRSRSDNTSGLL